MTIIGSIFLFNSKLRTLVFSDVHGCVRPLSPSISSVRKAIQEFLDSTARKASLLHARPTISLEKHMSGTRHAMIAGRFKLKIIGSDCSLSFEECLGDEGSSVNMCDWWRNWMASKNQKTELKSSLPCHYNVQSVRLSIGEWLQCGMTLCRDCMFLPINQHSHAKSSEAIQSNLWTAHQGTKAAHNRFSSAWHVTWAPISIGQSVQLLHKSTQNWLITIPGSILSLNLRFLSSEVWILKEVFVRTTKIFKKDIYTSADSVRLAQAWADAKYG